MGKVNLVDLDVIVHHRTERAVLVEPADDGSGERKVWIPRSLCELEMETARLGTLTAEEELLIEKGLL